MENKVEAKKTYAIVLTSKVRSELMALHAQFIAERDIILITPDEYVEMQGDGRLSGLPEMAIEEIRLYALQLEEYNFTEVFITAEDVRPQRENVQKLYGKNYYKQNRFRYDYVPNKRNKQRKYCHGDKK